MRVLGAGKLVSTEQKRTHRRQAWQLLEGPLSRGPTVDWVCAENKAEWAPQGEKTADEGTGAGDGEHHHLAGERAESHTRGVKTASAWGTNREQVQGEALIPR